MHVEETLEWWWSSSQNDSKAEEAGEQNEEDFCNDWSCIELLLDW